MEKKLLIAILVPIILTVVLIALLIYDGSNSSNQVDNPEKQGETQISPSPSASDALTPIPTETSESTPVTEPTTIPTPMPSATPTATPAPSPTAAPTSIETSQAEALPSQEEGQTTPGESREPVPERTYKVLYSWQGEDYTLISDRETQSFITLRHEDNAVRQTGFTYASQYEEIIEGDSGPILGYKNGQFIFIAQQHVVATDGQKETLLYSFEEESLKEGFAVKSLSESENRLVIEAASEETLLVIDFRTLKTEEYKTQGNADFLILSDDYLCYGEPGKIPGGGNYNQIYIAHDGRKELIGSVGDIDAYTVKDNLISFTSRGYSYLVDPEGKTLSSTEAISRERLMYYPVYGEGMVYNLSEMRFIHYNNPEMPMMSMKLPSLWTGECHYMNYLDMAVHYFYRKDQADVGLLPDKAGVFTLVDYTQYPLENNKFLLHSTVKEQLDSGMTQMGRGELFLLERVENINNDSIPFEIIYAWIPIEGESKAYQFYLYVPFGEDKTSSLSLVKQLIGFES